MRITCDTVEKPIVVSIAHFRKDGGEHPTKQTDSISVDKYLLYTVVLQTLRYKNSLYLASIDRRIRRSPNSLPDTMVNAVTS